MRKKLLTLALSLLVSYSFAFEGIEYNETPAEKKTRIKEENLEAYRKAENYVDAIHCIAFTPDSKKEKLKNVFRVDNYLIYVLINGDNNCFGGSGTSSYKLYTFSSDSGRVQFLSTDDLFEKNNLFLRWIENPKIQGNILSFTNKEHMEGDPEGVPNNYPINEFSYKIRLPTELDIDNERSNIRILERKLIRIDKFPPE